VGGIVHPHLRPRDVDGELAGEAGRVLVEYTRPDAAVGEQVDEEMGLGEVGGGVDALQKRTDTIPVMPSSSMPVRPDTLKYAAERATLREMLPRMPTAAVM